MYLDVSIFCQGYSGVIRVQFGSSKPCLGGFEVIPPDSLLDRYYEENVIGGPGSFMVVASTFEDFGRAVRSKLIREIS